VLTCGTTGAICEMIELTGDKAGEISGKTGVPCERMCAAEITKRHVDRGTTSGTTEKTYGLTGATYGMTAVTFVMTGGTSAAITADKFGRALGGGRRERRREDSCRRILLLPCRENDPRSAL
jgi:hypothetical protein